jgi:hypothetical protein
MQGNGMMLIPTDSLVLEERIHPDEPEVHPAPGGTIPTDVMTRVTEAHPISRSELRELAQRRFGDMIKGVVDLRRRIMLLDAELHADQESELLADGSSQSDLWGINLYPEVDGPDWLEFDSMINLRPSFGNRSRGVDDAATRDAIAELIGVLVAR